LVVGGLGGLRFGRQFGRCGRIEIQVRFFLGKIDGDRIVGKKRLPPLASVPVMRTKCAQPAVPFPRTPVLYRPALIAAKPAGPWLLLLTSGSKRICPPDTGVPPRMTFPDTSNRCTESPPSAPTLLKTWTNPFLTRIR
jgi:hypothetical protein